MINRRAFLKSAGAGAAALALSTTTGEAAKAKPKPVESDFAKRLEPVGRILQKEDWVTWGCSPVYGPEGRVHVLCAHWEAVGDASGPKGWLERSKIFHAVADAPGGPYEITHCVAKGRGGDHWDADMIHNPTAQRIGDRYALFYIGNNVERAQKQGKMAIYTQRIGLMLADHPGGPWKRSGDGPVLEAARDKECWDYESRYGATNPAYLHHPSGEHWLYYKAGRTGGRLRQIGLAVSDRLEGPYRRVHRHAPVVDFEPYGAQCEDPYVFIEDGRFYMVARDMNMFGHQYGVFMESDDGINWSEPKIAYHGARHYPLFAKEPEKSLNAWRGARFERPQVLMKEGRPEYLFVSFSGGEYHRSTGAVFKVRPKP